MKSKSHVVLFNVVENIFYIYLIDNPSGDKWIPLVIARKSNENNDDVQHSKSAWNVCKQSCDAQVDRAIYFATILKFKIFNWFEALYTPQLPIRLMFRSIQLFELSCEGNRQCVLLATASIGHTSYGMPSNLAFHFQPKWFLCVPIRPRKYQL